MGYVWQGHTWQEECKPGSEENHRYCTCESLGTKYRGSRTKFANENIENLKCPLCAFIWHSADKMRRPTDQGRQPKTPLEESLQFEIDFRAPYGLCSTLVESLGYCGFRL